MKLNTKLFSNDFSPNKRTAVVTIIIGSLAGITAVALFAAGVSLSLEPESAALTGATQVSDTLASGGKSLVFGTGTVTPPPTPTPTPTPPAPAPPPPAGGSRCPAFPAFPDAGCTGVIAGTVLTACNGNITASNVTYTKCLFNNSITLTGKNVKITNSRIVGVIAGDATLSGLVLTDVEIDGQNDTYDATSGVYGYTCIRCNVHHVAKGFSGNNFTVTDSYVHDLYGTPGSHNEAVLGSDGNIIISHSNLVSNFSASSNGNGGMSAAIALYTHSSYWGPLDNVLVEKTRISTTEAYYCVYGGNSSDSDGNPSNIRFISNVFVKNACGTAAVMVGWLRGNGNVWQSNTYSDGTAIPEPATGDYN